MRKFIITHPEDSTKTKTIIAEKEAGAINFHFSAWNYRFNYIETDTIIVLLRSAEPYPHPFDIETSNSYYFKWVEVGVNVELSYEK